MFCENLCLGIIDTITLLKMKKPPNIIGIQILNIDFQVFNTFAAAVIYLLLF